MSRQLLVLLLGELRLQLRQPLALLMLIVLPVLAGPGMLAGASLDHGSEAVEDEARRLTVLGPPELAGWIEAADALVVVPHGELGRDGIEAELVLEGRDATIRYRAEQPRSREARDRLRRVLRRHERALRAQRFTAAGAPVAPDEVLAVEVRDLRVGGDPAGVLGRFFTVWVLLSMTIAAMTTALDVVTGEKERGTIETLLTSRADREAIVLAKFLVVVLFTTLSGVVLVGSSAAASWLGIVGGGAELTRHLPFLLAATIPLAALVSAVQLTVATWAPDYKASSMLSAPVMLIVLAPAAVAALPIELNAILALAPIANVALAVRDRLAGELSPGMWAWVLVGAGLHAAGALAVAWRLHGRESALLGFDDPEARRRLGYHGRDAAALFGLAVVLTWFFASTAQALDLVWGMVFSHAVVFGGLGVAAVWWLGLPFGETLSLRAPSVRDLGLAAVAGLLAPCVGALVFTLQDPWLPVSSSFIEQMGQITLDDRPLWVAIVVFAVLPALCEELLFRGALLGLLRRSLAPAPRAIVVAVLFGAMHLAVVRFLPTTALGLLLTVAVLRSGSLWTGALIHLLNNAIAVSAGRWLDAEPSVWVYVAGALPAVAAVAAMGRRAPGR